VTALEIDLAATSRSGDAGYLAAHDLAGIADELGLEYRLVGGVSVALLTQVHGVADLSVDAVPALGLALAAPPTPVRRG
jgi:hypothetical protein